MLLVGSAGSCVCAGHQTDFYFALLKTRKIKQEPVSLWPLEAAVVELCVDFFGRTRFNLKSEVKPDLDQLGLNCPSRICISVVAEREK